MEVHHHSHTERKKWTHYLWEFLMLFFAVFCGFLAENQREHYVEHQREKEYMQSMVEDLVTDTAEYNSKLSLINSFLVPLVDTSMQIIYHNDITSPDVVRKMYKVVPACSQFLDLNVEDRTMSQLKNSGSLRIIRNKAVTDSLAAYWKVITVLNNTVLPGYDKVRLEVKNISFSLFNFNYYEGHNPYQPIISGTSPELLSYDKQQFIKLANFISNLYSQARGPIWRLMYEASGRASNLINLIRSEYHLK